MHQSLTYCAYGIHSTELAREKYQNQIRAVRGTVEGRSVQCIGEVKLPFSRGCGGTALWMVTVVEGETPFAIQRETPWYWRRGDPILEGGVEGCSGKFGTIGDGLAAPCGWTMKNAKEGGGGVGFGGRVARG